VIAPIGLDAGASGAAHVISPRIFKLCTHPERENAFSGGLSVAYVFPGSRNKKFTPFVAGILTLLLLHVLLGATD
jgi:hypothetical protein